MNPKQRSRGRGPNINNNNGGGKKHGGGGGGGGGGMPRPNQVFDSNGPECRIRGNAHQVLEKYLTLARDASLQGDRVAAENFYQHAEHYFRVINAQNQNNGRPRQQMPTPADEQSMQSENEDENGNEYAAESSSESAAESSPRQQVIEIPGEGPQPSIEPPAAPSRDLVPEQAAAPAPQRIREPRRRPPREPREPRERVREAAAPSPEPAPAPEPTEA